MKLAKEALSEIPYLDVEVIGDRIIDLAPLWDDGKWQHWIPGPDGRLAWIPTQ